MLYVVCRDVKKNEDTRWNEGFRDLGYEYNKWGNMGCFGNPIISCSISVIFYII